MTATLLASTVAFVIVLAAVPLIQWFCERARILDNPGPLKIHTRPVPRLGGVAIFFAVLAAVFTANHQIGAAEWHFLTAASVVWTVGLLDDLRGLHPIPRLLAQVAAAAILWSGGWHLHILGLALGGLGDLAAVCIFVILLVNSWNFLDGSDGLAAGFTCVVALSYAILPQGLLSPGGFAIACALATACAAFLFFNAHPASIFLGDSGSTLLGFLVAFLGLDYTRATPSTRHTQLFPLVVASLPLLDAVRIVIQRIIQHGSVFEGSRNHFYDQILAKGQSPRKVAFISWAVGLICAGVALLSVYFRISQAWFPILMLLVAIWIAAVSSAPAKRARHVNERDALSAAP